MNKKNSSQINTPLKSPNSNPQIQDSQRSKSNLQTSQKKEECVLKDQKMRDTVNTFVSEHEIYYRHIQGLCDCYICTCGKHLCQFTKNSHLQNPFKQPQSQSIYQHDFNPKKNLKDIKFNYGMYEADKSDIKPLESESINHHDYKRPGLDAYGQAKSCKQPERSHETPQQMGRSQYKRDYLEWGTSYIPIKGSHQRTTIDAMPFNGLSSYQKDYKNLKGNKAEPLGNNYKCTTVKSPIPFQGLTTNQQFYKPIPPGGEKVIIYKQRDELFTGVPTFKGEFQSLYQKDYIGYDKHCPVLDRIKNTNA